MFDRDLVDGRKVYISNRTFGEYGEDAIYVVSFYCITDSEIQMGWPVCYSQPTADIEYHSVEQ